MKFDNRTVYRNFSIRLLHKGYSFLEFCKLYNKRYNCSMFPYRISTAINDRATEHQDIVADNAQKLLEELPNKSVHENDLYTAIKPLGYTVREVYEKYIEKTGEQIAYTTFAKQVRNNYTPKARAVSKIAFEIVKEMTNDNHASE